jgi:hypothetical protein
MAVKKGAYRPAAAGVRMRGSPDAAAEDGHTPKPGIGGKPSSRMEPDTATTGFSSRPEPCMSAVISEYSPR